MKGSIAAKMTSSFLADMDALVDQSIDSMSPKQLKEFQKKRKKITADCRSRAVSSSSPRETEKQEKPVLQR